MKAIRELYYSLHNSARVRAARRAFAAAQDGLNIELEAPRIGFFAQLSQCLVVLYHAENMDQPIRVRLVSSNYADTDRGTDWLDYFFEWVSRAPEANAKSICIHHYREIGLQDMADFDLSGADALFSRHLRLRPEIPADVDAFCRANGVDAQTLAFHYRGTDKSLEAPRVSHKTALSALTQFLRERPEFTSVFVASDEEGFIAACKQALGGVRIVTYEEARPIRGEPLHFGRRKSGNYHLGKDALMLSLIISRCGAVLRTTSFLSGWSSVFNPGLEVTLLNAPYPGKCWFPETAILRTAKILQLPASG